MCQTVDLLAIRFNHEVCHFTVKRIARGIEFLHAYERIGSLQQRAMFAVPRSLPQRVWRGVEVKHRATILEPFAIHGTQYDPAAGRQHDVGLSDEVGKHCFLAVAEAVLAFELEDDGDAHAEASLQLDVSVVETLVEPAREEPSERRLAA